MQFLSPLVRHIGYFLCSFMVDFWEVLSAPSERQMNVPRIERPARLTAEGFLKNAGAGSPHLSVTLSPI